MSPLSKEKETASRIRKVGPYRLLKELGRGGMAIVYRGLHEAIQREVAIKELLPEVRDKEAISRFRREALALAAFRHQGIVTLYDLIEKNDSLFMILELVDGPTLADLLKDGPLPPDVAAVVGAQVASALEHAHFHRVIHRDIKPSNVMLTKSGEVKLMDFGIAKDVGLEALTQEGFAIGTPSYMSPEQVTGAKVDGRTDIFSLGVVLYEALTGFKPFTGSTAGEVFARIRDGKYRPVTKLAPKAPTFLAQVVQKAMATKLDRRYSSASAMRRDLELYAAREVSLSHSALLIAFLRHRNQLTDTEAFARVAEDVSLGSLELPRHRGRMSRWLLAGAAAGGAAYLTHPYWLPLLGGH